MKTQASAAVFPVSDVTKALRFYVDVLGFEEDFRFGEYAGVKYGDACIHLTNQADKNTKPPGSGNCYIFADEVDAYYELIISRDAHAADKPKDWPYGMRDFIAYDLDNNQITFGTEVKK